MYSTENFKSCFFIVLGYQNCVFQQKNNCRFKTHIKNHCFGTALYKTFTVELKNIQLCLEIVNFRTMTESKSSVLLKNKTLHVLLVYTGIVRNFSSNTRKTLIFQNEALKCVMLFHQQTSWCKAYVPLTFCHYDFFTFSGEAQTVVFNFISFRTHVSSV